MMKDSWHASCIVSAIKLLQ